MNQSDYFALIQCADSVTPYRTDKLRELTKEQLIEQFTEFRALLNEYGHVYFTKERQGLDPMLSIAHGYPF